MARHAPPSTLPVPAPPATAPDVDNGSSAADHSARIDHRRKKNWKRAKRKPTRVRYCGFEAIVSTPDEFAARIQTDIPKWAKVIRAANIKVE